MEMASYFPVIAIMIMILGGSKGRELRPSYHGLDYQSTPPSGEKLPPEVKEFFGSSSAPTSKSSSNVALPKAMNSNDTAWWNRVAGENGGSKGGDRLRHVLLVASLACGVTGAALLVASAFIYFVKHKKRQTPPSIENNTNKAIVIQ
ncbi:uncharacterized protein LOC105636851 [Jatropha curcas]|nr:uncharacterized protein LOC105636851 [Jatropha curcas]